MHKKIEIYIYVIYIKKKKEKKKGSMHTNIKDGTILNNIKRIDI